MPGSRAPQRLDSVVRTLTTAALAVSLVGAVVYLSITVDTTRGLSGLQAVVVGWAGVVVGFYFGGHIAQNTAALEEDRMREAARVSEESATRSEASAVRSERRG